MIHVNLLPVREAQRKEKLRAYFSVMLLSLVAFFLACAGLFINIDMKISNERKHNEQVERQIRMLRTKIGKVNEYKRLRVDLEKKLEILASLKRNKSGPVYLMDHLSAALPPKLWLNSFKQRDRNIELKGTGINERTVATFLRDLEASPYYQDVELRVTQQKQEGELKLQDFTVSTKVEDPNAVAKTADQNKN